MNRSRTGSFEIKALLFDYGNTIGFVDYELLAEEFSRPGRRLDSQVVGIEKPDPRIFHLALDRLGVRPEEALFAGDIYAIDMVGARAAGIEGKLMDIMDLYHWVEHAKIRGIHEFHLLDED